MPLEAYVPSEVWLGGEPLADVMVVTLHDPDSDAPHGTLTAARPPAVGTRAALRLVGRREGRVFAVEVDEIEVCQASAVGCEFTVFGQVRRTPVTPET